MTTATPRGWGSRFVEFPPRNRLRRFRKTSARHSGRSTPQKSIARTHRYRPAPGLLASLIMTPASSSPGPHVAAARTSTACLSGSASRHDPNAPARLPTSSCVGHARGVWHGGNNGLATAAANARADPAGGTYPRLGVERSAVPNAFHGRRLRCRSAASAIVPALAGLPAHLASPRAARRATATRRRCPGEPAFSQLSFEVFSQAPHQVRHARDHVAHRHVLPNPQAHRGSRRT